MRLESNLFFQSPKLGLTEGVGVVMDNPFLMHCLIIIFIDRQVHKASDAQNRKPSMALSGCHTGKFQAGHRLTRGTMAPPHSI